MAVEEDWVWKKNTPFLYDLVISHAPEWPSLIVQWLSSSFIPSSSSVAAPVRHLILNTHTSDEAPNFLMLVNIHSPR